jgi:hypothetical protein
MVDPNPAAPAMVGLATVSADENQPKKHHYVPVFYQRYFTNDKGLLWVYDRKLKTYKELPPPALCCQTDLYALKPRGRPRDRRIETQYLARVDGMSAKTFSGFSKDETLNPERLGSFIFFLALQHSRVPANGEMITATYQAAAQAFMEVAYANVDRAKQMIADYESQTGKKLEADAEKMVDDVREKRLEIKATEVPFLESLWKHTKIIFYALADFQWELLESPPQTGFIITDNPVTLVPPPKATTIGFGIPGTSTYLPLTRKFCLRLGVTQVKESFVKLDRESVRFINQNLAINSDRFIMSADKMQLVSVVNRSGSTDLNPNPRFRLDQVPDPKGGLLQMITNLPRRPIYF